LNFINLPSFGISSSSHKPVCNRLYVPRTARDPEDRSAGLLFPMIVFGTVGTVTRKYKIVPKEWNDNRPFAGQQSRSCARPFDLLLLSDYVFGVWGFDNSFVDGNSLYLVWERLKTTKNKRGGHATH